MKWRERLSKREASGVVTLIFTILVIQIVIFLFNLPDKRVKSAIVQERIVEEQATVRKQSNTTVGLDKDSIEPNDNVEPEISWARSTTRSMSKSTTGLTKEPKEEFFEFNPNTVTIEEFMRLGLSERQAATIINYRSRGGVFREREDFLKMYVVSEELYNRVKDYIVIPAANNRSSENKFPENELSENEFFENELLEDELSFSRNRAVSDRSLLPLLELNRADSIDLLDLPGIGPYYASRIFRYRNRIGGFVSKEQLKEISGIDDERYSMLESRVYVDTSMIYRADLNTIAAEHLSSNPYIGSYLARAILRFKEQEGDIDLRVLLENKIIDQKRYELLKHYYQ